MSKWPDSLPSAELKSWLDNCLVPILAKVYLSTVNKTVATDAQPVADSAAEAVTHSKVNR